MISKNHSKFPPGQILATPGALEKARQTSAESFSSGSPRGDWGDVYEEDRRLNDEALINGSRLLSAYRTALGEKLWIITEAADDSGKRAATTILLPSEY